MGGGQTFMMNRAAPEALLKLLLLSPTLPSFLLLSTPTAHPTPSFILPPLKNPYNGLLAEVLMEKDEDLNEAEMEEREMEDGGEGSNIFDEQSIAGGSAEI